MALTHKKRAFADHWLEFGNATDAHEHAGYKSKSRYARGQAAHKVLKDPEIQAYMAKRLEETDTENKGRIAHVVNELIAILRADPLDAIDDSGAFLPLREWPQPLRRALASMDNQEMLQYDRDSGENVVVGHVKKCRFWSKTEAAKQLLQKYGVASKVEVEVIDLAELVRQAAEEEGDDNGSNGINEAGG